MVLEALKSPPNAEAASASPTGCRASPPEAASGLKAAGGDTAATEAQEPPAVDPPAAPTDAAAPESPGVEKSPIEKPLDVEEPAPPATEPAPPATEPSGTGTAIPAAIPEAAAVTPPAAEAPMPTPEEDRPAENSDEAMVEDTCGSAQSGATSSVEAGLARSTRPSDSWCLTLQEALEAQFGADAAKRFIVGHGTDLNLKVDSPALPPIKKEVLKEVKKELEEGVPVAPVVTSEQTDGSQPAKRTIPVSVKKEMTSPMAKSRGGSRKPEAPIGCKVCDPVDQAMTQVNDGLEADLSIVEYTTPQASSRKRDLNALSCRPVTNSRTRSVMQRRIRSQDALNINQDSFRELHFGLSKYYDCDGFIYFLDEVHKETPNLKCTLCRGVYTKMLESGRTVRDTNVPAAETLERFRDSVAKDVGLGNVG